MSVATRSKRLVAYYGVYVAVVLLLVGLAALGGAWTVYTNPPTETVTRQTNTQRISSGVQTSAIVTGNTTLYEEGERLTNKPVYLTRAAPHLTLLAVTNLPDDQRVSVRQRLTLEVRATRNQQTFWEETRVLLENETVVTDGRTVARARLNITALEGDLAAKRTEVGQIGTFHTDLRYEVSYETNRYDGSLTATSPLQITTQAYWLGSSLSAQRTHSQAVTRRVTRPPDRTTSFGLGLAGVVALVAAVGVGVYQHRTDPTAVDREVTKSRYEEWISEGEFPTSENKRYIRISSLEDLVDVAIDSNKRVIYDPTYEAYAVSDQDLVYYFSGGAVDIDAWLDI